MTISRTLPQLIGLSFVAAMAAASVQAQPVYRIVGPDGKVTFSDRAPEKAAPGARSGVTQEAASAPSASELPYELRQIAQRFPVTLYTGDNCSPCGTARNMLMQRGVPFTERTVTTNDDIDALQRLSGAHSLPFGTIGGQQLVGYSEADWSQYLDAAGYPKQSRLPANYRRTPAAPLVAVKAIPSPAAKSAESETQAPARVRAPMPAAVPAGPTPSNPAGIKF